MRAIKRSSEGVESNPLRVQTPRIPEVLELLRSAYTFDYLGNLDDPLDELVYIVLSTRTRFSVFQQTFRELRERFTSWEEVLTADHNELEEVLAPAGLSRKKAGWLKETLSEIKRMEGKVSLECLASMDDTQAEDYLTALPGVGLKTARCVLMYSLGREVFPVDANVRRLLERLRIVPPHVHYYYIHDLAQDQVPPRLRRDFHIYSVLHGVTTCTPKKPKCAECILAHLCPFPGAETPDLPSGPPKRGVSR